MLGVPRLKIFLVLQKQVSATADIEESIDDINNGYLDTLLRDDLKLSNGKSPLSSDTLNSLKNTGRSTFKTFYVDKRLSKWDSKKQS